MGPAPACTPSSASSRAFEQAQDSITSGAKRRKVRKGTSSCWECKRRKVRCTYTNPFDAVCIHCLRRGTRCLAQENEDESLATTPAGGRSQTGVSGRMIRVETSVNHQVHHPASTHGSGSRAATPRAPFVSHIPSELESNLSTASKTAPKATELLPVVSFYQPLTDDTNLAVDARERHSLDRSLTASSAAVSCHKHEKLSLALHAAFPRLEDLEILWKAGPHISIHFDQVMRMGYPDLQISEAKWAGTLLRVPDPKTHPVLLARHMFHIVTFVQYLDPVLMDQVKGLSEQPRDMMKRLANTAISLVTTHDDLLGTVEALETIMAEGIYHANSGNLRRAWVVFRRAMAVAQLMGMHRNTIRTMRLVDQDSKFDAGLLWDRIVYTDRFLCLMLGLPQGSMDRRIPRSHTTTVDTHMGHLERLHSAISSRILERNDSEDGTEDLAMTRGIDLELQAAARTMPSGWWRAPNLTAIAAETSNDDKAVFWGMLQLVNQLYHYNLLNQIHLPFLLRFDSTKQGHNYSQTMCVNASREVLSRFIEYRSFNQVASCCRAVDFFALLAALTLLLAHLDSHTRQHVDGAVDFLAHQHPGDRAMIELAHEKMQLVGRVNQDPLSFKNVQLLRRLLLIEAEARHDHACDSGNMTRPIQGECGVEHANVEQQGHQGTTDSVFRLRIPFFGIIQICREGITTKEAEQTEVAAGQTMVDRPTNQYDYSTSDSAPSTSTPMNDISADSLAVELGFHREMPRWGFGEPSKAAETAPGSHQGDAWAFRSQPSGL